MQIVKVSTPWSHIDYNSRINKNITNSDFFFDFSESCSDCDFWIIWGGIKKEIEKVMCQPQNVIYLTDEVHEQRIFNNYFLDQFSAIITCRLDLKHKSIIYCHELNTWLINKNYEWLAENNLIHKTKNLSVVCSDHTWLPGHKLRFAFVNKLIGHFKDKLDVFGKGFNPIEDKFDALATYKYSIAIENSSIPGYFTEKISDCYLANVMPIYYGCPDIENYFDPNSLLLVDPNNYKDAILKIEQVIFESRHEKVFPLLQNEKKKYLEEYHIFSKLPQIMKKDFLQQRKKKFVTIKKESFFEKKTLAKRFIKRVLK